MKKIFYFAVITAAMAQEAFSAIVPSGTTTINWMESYPTLPQGGVIFRLADPINECSGYWLNPASEGYDTTVSIILASYHAKTPLQISGKTDVTWPHSQNSWCEVYSVKYPN